MFKQAFSKQCLKQILLYHSGNVTLLLLPANPILLNFACIFSSKCSGPKEMAVVLTIFKLQTLDVQLCFMMTFWQYYIELEVMLYLSPFSITTFIAKSFLRIVSSLAGFLHLCSLTKFINLADKAPVTINTESETMLFHTPIITER